MSRSEEISTEDLYSPFAISEELVSARDQKTAGTISIDFDKLLQPPLLLYEDVKEGCGGKIWEAGMALTEYLLHEPQLASLHRKRILELGAGGGLVGLALGLALSTNKENMHHSEGSQVEIHLTDQAPMLPLMQRNLELNRLSDRGVTVGILDWGTKRLDQRSAPDVILAADCVYFEPAFQPLLHTLDDLLGTETICFFCYKKRRRADLRFMKSCKKMFKVEEIKPDAVLSSWSRENLFMYRIMRKT